MLKRILWLTVLSLCHVAAWAQWSPDSNVPPDRFKSEQTEARFMAYAPEGIAPNRPVWLGIEIDHQPDWHTYWLNSGESGIPTEIQWQLPPGWEADAIQWPTPKKFTLGPLANYGYDDRVLLAVPIRITAQPSADPVTIKAQANWLACRTECIPEFADLSLTLPLDIPITQHAQSFQQSRSRLPQPHSGSAVMRIERNQLVLRIDDIPFPWRGQKLEVYPETPNLIVPGASWESRWTGASFEASLPLHPDRELSPEQVNWVIAISPPEHGLAAPAGLRAKATMQDTWPPTQATTIAPALQAALANTAASKPPTTSAPPTWLLSLLLALLGGMLLNLMPCVFPVLAIKVLAFAQSDNTRLHRLSGLAYTAGVVASFSALAAVLLALRSAGEAVGWGFQLQHPATVASLAILFTLIALNLFGWFEVTQLLPARWGGLRLRHPIADAAWSGVLSTAIASPCTAPFMGAALGAAIAMPAPEAMLLFATVGLGMALPYLLMSWFPVLSRLLPGPGAWMQTFRELMAFPMLATVIWLLWVLGQQSGIHGASALLLWLLLLGFGCWLIQRTRRGSALWRVFAFALIATSAYWLWPMATQLQPRASTTSASAEGWQAWTPQVQEQALASGRRVFVDFTAAWCVTCQVNELGAMRDPLVEQAFTEGRWLRLRADWTQHDADITRALNALQRNGVPTYAVYHPGRPPEVLSELLTRDQLLRALEPR